MPTHGSWRPLVTIGEAMVACVLADHYLRHRAQAGDGVTWPFAPPGI